MNTNIKETLKEYVQNTETWFYWYHNPKRLKDIHCNKELNPNNCKKPWKFKNNKEKEKQGIYIQEDLLGFLDAVLDEVRIKKANKFSYYALYISDNQDFAYFREAVAKRETSADINIDRQRDHAVHTLYNYLLGWYIFDNCELLRNAFIDHFEKLNIITKESSDKEKIFYKYNLYRDKITESNFHNSITLVNEFGDIWPIASLLHDIGYILEGNLSSASPEVELERVHNGSKIIHDYFNHWFWKDYDVDFKAAQHIATVLGVDVPDFKSTRSLASLGDHLQNIGSCENIRLELKIYNTDIHRLYTKPPVVEPEPISELHGLNREAFALWHEHYESYGNKEMQDVLTCVNEVYRDVVWSGFNQGKHQGKRKLDHGVCSGLITLQAITFFYDLFFGFKKIEKILGNESDKSKKFESLQKESKNSFCNFVSLQMYEKINSKVTEILPILKLRSDDNLPVSFWFKKTLWATAAAAIHSIVQTEQYKEYYFYFKQGRHPKNIKELEDFTELKLKLEDDPLAYLGLLVDLLQEWDRYTVSKSSAFSGKEPLQSIDVMFNHRDKKIVQLQYPNSYKLEKLFNEVKKNLKEHLEGSESIVEFGQWS